MREKGAPVNGPLLEEKAESLAKSLGVPGFEAYNGWLYRWKEHHDLSYKKMHGESSDADLKSAEKWLSDVLPNLIQGWSPEDIYNCDETGLFYQALPDGTYALKGEKVAGGKKCKQRLTVLLCCNSEGSHMLPPLVIATSKNPPPPPRCFKNVQQLPVLYEANATAWMTSELFCKWLVELDIEMKRKKRNILLFADNAPCHAVHNLPRLTNVQLEFLPPNTTSRIQPLDRRIIRAMKQHYRKRLLSNLVAKLESSSEKPLTEFIKTTTVLDALHFLKQAWQPVQPSLERNDDMEFNWSSLGIDEEEFDHYVTMDDNIDCYGDLTDDQIIQEVQGIPKADDNEEVEEEEVQIPLKADTLQALSTIRHFLMYILEDFYPIEEKVCSFMADTSQHQTVLADFFKFSKA